jgi:hypothetical protein
MFGNDEMEATHTIHSFTTISSLHIFISGGHVTEI